MCDTECMFYRGESVRSRFHGLGEVVLSGDTPRVRFLDGLETFVSEDTITSVPSDEYDAEIRNRMEIERYLTLRINGVAPPLSPPTPKPTFDLTSAMIIFAQSAQRPAIEVLSCDSCVLSFN